MNANEITYDEIFNHFSKYAYDICQILVNAEPSALLACINVQWWQSMGKPKTFLGQKVVPMQLGDVVELPMFIDWATKENGVHEDEKGK